MAHLVSIKPIWASESIKALRIATNPFLLKDQSELWDALIKGASWGDEEEIDSAAEYHKGVAAIEAARAKGGMKNAS